MLFTSQFLNVLVINKERESQMNNTLSEMYLSKSAVLEMLEISERNLENIVKSQRFPPGVRIGKKLYWAPEIVQSWLDTQFAAQLEFKPPIRRSMTRLARR